MANNKQVYLNGYQRSLTQLIDESLTTSLDQSRIGDVTKVADCRQMVSKGRVLP